MKSVQLSLIIVTYNSAEEIETCLTSLKEATKQFSTQVILIDNASQDETRNIVENISSMFSNIQLILNSENRGFTKSVNQGLRLSDGEHILLLNPDTILPENTFTTLLPMFKKHPNTGIVSPQFLNADGSIQPSCRRFPRRRDVFFHFMGLHLLFPQSPIYNGWKMGDFDHREESFVDQPQGAFLLVKREAYQQVGFLDESFPMFFSDVDWCQRFANKGLKILFTPKISIIHHKGRSIYKNRIPLIWSSHKSFIRYFQKYFQGAFINYITAVILIITAVLRIVLSWVYQNTVSLKK